MYFIRIENRPSVPSLKENDHVQTPEMFGASGFPLRFFLVCLIWRNVSARGHDVQVTDRFFFSSSTTRHSAVQMPSEHKKPTIVCSSETYTYRAPSNAIDDEACGTRKSTRGDVVTISRLVRDTRRHLLCTETNNNQPFLVAFSRCARDDV